MQAKLPSAADGTAWPSRECFLGWVKDALANLYDPVRLEISPLVELLGLRGAGGAGAATALRERLRQAIEALRPDPSLPFGRPEWAGYRLLWMRYIQLRSQFAIGEELGLSRSAFYRQHQQAVEAVAALLWEQRPHKGSSPGEATASSGQTADGDQVQHEVLRLAQEAHYGPVDLPTVLASVHHTILSLAEQRGVAVEIVTPPDLPLAWGEHALLRQLILNLLSEALLLAAGRALTLQVSAQGDETHWELRGLDPQRCTPGLLESAEGFAVGQSILGALGRRLSRQQQADGSVVLSFTLPNAPARTILIVDDNPDTTNLYCRYLQQRGYALQVAYTADEALAILAEERPDLILLDVLLPQQDGWAILEQLKLEPETASIPVIVCSVLRQPQLALALGAVRVLRKPITEEALVEAVRAALSRADSVG